MYNNNQTLNLENRVLSNDDFKYLVNNLKDNLNIKYLNLRNVLIEEKQKFGNVRCYLLTKILCKNSTLVSLDLSDNEIRDMGIKSISDALNNNWESSDIADNHNKKLEYLYLSNNNFSNVGCEALSRLLIFNSLIYLDLSSCLGKNGFNDELRFLSNGLENNNTLEYLILSSNFITDCRFLANALKKNTTLKRLDLSDNKINDDGVLALSESLKQNNTLEYLELFKNKIGDKGAEYLGECLIYNNGLFILTLDFNQIKNIDKISRSLMTNKKLQLLSLAHNNIENVILLSESLKLNSTLLMLNLAENFITDIGFKHLADALKTNNTLTGLSLENMYAKNQSKYISFYSSHQMGRVNLKYLTEALKYNTSLTELNLSKNYLGDDEIQYLIELLNINSCLCSIGNKCDTSNKNYSEVQRLLSINLYSDKHQEEINLKNNNRELYIKQNEERMEELLKINNQITEYIKI